jgi:hypothetical protein
VLATVFGSCDSNVKIIEKKFGVAVHNRIADSGEDVIVVSGDQDTAVGMAASAVAYLVKMAKYNENIKKIDSNIANIEPKCNVIYKELSVNKICDSYKELYEKLINLYISDIENYNNKITSYNEYKKESINQFEMVHKEYIDYNLDQIYKGKDENNETNKEEK